MALARISICPPVIGTTCAAAQISAAGPRNPATGAIAATTKASAATAKPLVKPTAHRGAGPWPISNGASTTWTEASANNQPSARIASGHRLAG